jgi:hypothetical protein
MSSKVLVVGKIFTFIWLSCLSSNSVFGDNLLFFFRCVRQVQQPEGRLG